MKWMAERWRRNRKGVAKTVFDPVNEGKHLILNAAVLGHLQVTMPFVLGRSHIKIPFEIKSVNTDGRKCFQKCINSFTNRPKGFIILKGLLKLCKKNDHQVRLKPILADVHQMLGLKAFCQIVVKHHLPNQSRRWSELTNLEKKSLSLLIKNYSFYIKMKLKMCLCISSRVYLFFKAYNFVQCSTFLTSLQWIFPLIKLLFIIKKNFFPFVSSYFAPCTSFLEQIMRKSKEWRNWHPPNSMFRHLKEEKGRENKENYFQFVNISAFLKIPVSITKSCLKLKFKRAGEMVDHYPKKCFCWKNFRSDQAGDACHAMGNAAISWRERELSYIFLLPLKGLLHYQKRE
ncbi:hypothetical protein EGR_05708 [Echinococcus granulosus]|uniref:Uncharacterized protein n=1 Tax=Echinococcus granulosus TaxID=6210 RepID=W6UMV9_ECHGR|nr:hypothetical protein EGR_05708 [Echinococcus granulosus]EUB59457.1 hypothetical protein EGR_05708 [Echinococcus granulosus]